ncbi:unnamed protein product [Prorocentrum cordatum]|uniref:Peptidylprolyl isomerase n=1 Tax=Prorocentrum cordatum TaxID=2364126 RepID=A0ABN9SJ22_9DINO|nr:unnamed protein product [Polarella glacialis]
MPFGRLPPGTSDGPPCCGGERLLQGRGRRAADKPAATVEPLDSKGEKCSFDVIVNDPGISSGEIEFKNSCETFCKVFESLALEGWIQEGLITYFGQKLCDGDTKAGGRLRRHEGVSPFVCIPHPACGGVRRPCPHQRRLPRRGRARLRPQSDPGGV